MSFLLSLLVLFKLLLDAEERIGDLLKTIPKAKKINMTNACRNSTNSKVLVLIHQNLNQK
jgi:hypothetical protein